MKAQSDGKEYENFVAMIYQAILEAEKRSGNIASVKIEQNKTIISKSGAPAEIDIYWEYQIAGITHSVAIECKNYNKNIDIPRVRDFARKIENISGLKGLIVTKKGFSENAIKEAASDNIDLLVIREPTDEDWEGRLKIIKFQIHALSSARVTSMEPKLNKDWLLANGYKMGDQINLQAPDNIFVLEDKSDGFKHSIYDLRNHHFFENKGTGVHIWTKNFVDGWVHSGDKSFKLDKISIEYDNRPPIKTEFEINFEDYVLAIMDYVSGKMGKYLVLSTGERRNFN